MGTKLAGTGSFVGRVADGCSASGCLGGGGAGGVGGRSVGGTGTTDLLTKGNLPVPPKAILIGKTGEVLVLTSN